MSGVQRNLRPLFITVALWVCAAALPLGVALSQWPWGDPPREGIAGYDYPVGPPLQGLRDPRLLRLPDESDERYTQRVSEAIYEAVYRCDSSELRQSWGAVLMPKLLPWAPVFPGQDVGILVPGHLRCGLSGQVAHLLIRTLIANKLFFKSAVADLSGHMVVLVPTKSGTIFVVDPYFGIGPFYVPWDDPAELSRVITSVYGEAFRRRGFNPAWVEAMRNIYMTSDRGYMYSIWHSSSTLELLQHHQWHWLRWERPVEWALMGVGSAALLMLLRRYMSARR